MNNFLRYRRLVNVNGLDIIVTLVPERRLRKLWSYISDKPLPEIQALLLTNNDFNAIHDSYLKNASATATSWKEELIRRFSEYGKDAKLCDNSKEVAAWYDPDNKTIFIRRKYNSNKPLLDKLLKHELKHALDES